MEHLLFTLANPISKVLLILGGGVIGIAVLAMQALTKLRGSFKPYQKATLFYLLISVLFFSLIGITAHPIFFTTPEPFFIFYQACFFIAGLVHYRFMYRYLKWSGDEKSFWLELAYTVIIAMLGALFFLVVYNYLSENSLGLIMASSALFFIVPFFFFNSYKKAVAIPVKIRKQWLYPVHKEIAEPDDDQLKNLLIISFEFQKQTGDAHYTNFRAKAPADMAFGQLFYYFINDYNERHPDNRIQFISTAGQPHGWIFFKKPKWHSFITRYIDTDKTIFNNQIRENDVIICGRSVN